MQSREGVMGGNGTGGEGHSHIQTSVSTGVSSNAAPLPDLAATCSATGTGLSSCGAACTACSIFVVACPTFAAACSRTPLVRLLSGAEILPEDGSEGGVRERDDAPEDRVSAGVMNRIFGVDDDDATWFSGVGLGRLKLLLEGRVIFEGESSLALVSGGGLATLITLLTLPFASLWWIEASAVGRMRGRQDYSLWRGSMRGQTGAQHIHDIVLGKRGEE